jgi:hypothetical protein
MSCIDRSLCEIKSSELLDLELILRTSPTATEARRNFFTAINHKTSTRFEGRVEHMSAISRRTFLSEILPGAIVATASVASIGLITLNTAEALTLATSNAVRPESLVKDVQATTVDPRGPHHRRWGPRRRDPNRRPNRWTCWQHRGRNRCGWR